MNGMAVAGEDDQNEGVQLTGTNGVIIKGAGDRVYQNTRCIPILHERIKFTPLKLANTVSKVVFKHNFHHLSAWFLLEAPRKLQEQAEEVQRPSTRMISRFCTEILPRLFWIVHNGFDSFIYLFNDSWGSVGHQKRCLSNRGSSTSLPAASKDVSGSHSQVMVIL